MQQLIDSYKRNGNLHHAYAFEGDTKEILPELVEFFENQLKFIVQANPDYKFEQFDMFGIDEARALREAQLNKSLTGGKKIFVIAAQGMTLEAQNALLKVFEEPTFGTHFFLILDSFERLISTLRSRIFFVSRITASKNDFFSKGKKFLSSSITERMSQIESISETKNKTEAKELLHSIEISLSHLLKESQDSEVVFSLEEILRTKHYLEDRAPSIKMLLEHIACVTPVVL